MHGEVEIKLIKFITLRYADPICSIDLSDKFLLYGTMLGTAACYLINHQKLITLSETQEEHISGVKIEENKDNPKDNKLYVCVGDEKVITFNATNENNNEIPKLDEKNLYQPENEHSQKCDKCFTMLKNDYIVRTFIEFPPDTKTNYRTYDTQVSIKHIHNLDQERIEIIPMSNYCVPFDFDGKNYIFIDFIKENERQIRLYNLDSKQFQIDLLIENFKEKIGHISLLKILKNNEIFLVRNYNICEFRNLKFEFKRILNLSCDEVLAFDVMYTDENDFESFIIVIVDLNCNVFLYNNKRKKGDFWFNMENLNIEQVIKDQRFFSMGYPYYIKISKQYLAISSDYGCLLLQHSQI